MKNNPPSPRQTALNCLRSWHAGRSFAETLVDRECSRTALPSADRHLVQALVFGVLRNQTWLDHVIGTLRKGRLDVEARLILQLGLSQLFLLGMADHAAVYETVNLASVRLRGLVNAILRNALRREKTILEEREKLPLSIHYSTPAWLVRRWTEQMGPQMTRDLLRWNNTTPRLYVRANPLMPMKNIPASLAPLDRAPGWFSVEGLLPLEEIKTGSLYVADPSTRYSIDLLAPQPGEEILDACAAPGGKSFACAIQMEGQGEVVSCDLHPHKKKLIQAGADRLGLANITPMTADGKVFRPEWENAFDRVLVDAPCSGLGVIRKKPDIRYKDRSPLLDLPKVQREILATVARYVKSNGLLVYSTCTLNPAENEEVVERFLAKEPDYGLAEPLKSWVHGRGGLDCDGFFTAVLVRKGGSG